MILDQILPQKLLSRSTSFVAVNKTFDHASQKWIRNGSRSFSEITSMTFLTSNWTKRAVNLLIKLNNNCLHHFMCRYQLIRSKIKLFSIFKDHDIIYFKDLPMSGGSSLLS
jgi:hypothetical protein